MGDISSLVNRVRTLELVTYGEDESSASDRGSIVVGSTSVPATSALSASAASFAPASASTSVSAPTLPVSFSAVVGDLVPLTASVSDSREVYITPLAGRLRGGAPSGSRQTSGSEDMIVIKTAEQFLAAWAGLATDEERQVFENEHISSPDQVVVNAIMKKSNERTQYLLGQLNNQLQESKAETAAARAAADAAIAAQANQVNLHSEAAHKPKPPPSFENKEKDLEIKKWLVFLENHLTTCPDKDYLRIASSYLGGKPRSFWQSKLDMRLKDPNPIADPKVFFRETLISGYGLKDETQSRWDAWHKLRQASGEDISVYNVAFEQARADLAEEIHDEQVLIEKYKSGLQTDIRELARVTPSGQRWMNLNDLITFCTLQWPTIQARLDKKVGGNHKAPSEKVGGKRKSMSPNRSGRSKGSASGSGSGSGNGNSSKFPKLSAEQKAKNIADKVCHICGSPDHFSPTCPKRRVDWKDKKGKGNNKKKDFS